MHLEIEILNETYFQWQSQQQHPQQKEQSHSGINKCYNIPLGLTDYLLIINF